MNENIDILLSRYFSGEASPQELEQLDVWLAESAGNEAYFDSMTMLYQKSAFIGNVPDFNTPEALDDFKAYMEKEQNQSSQKSFRLAPYIRTAAAIAVLLMGLFTFFISSDNAQIIQLAATDVTKEFILQDGIKLSLSPESTIEYSEKNEYDVKLTGKAIFSIEGDKENKFVVQAGETFIRHIGTVFTVSAYEIDNTVTVEVHEGEVLFYTQQNEGISIYENQTAIFNSETKEFTLLAINHVDRELKFNSAHLGEVVNILESYYNVPILFQSSYLRNLVITVSFEPSEPIENVLDIIAETLSLNISSNGNSFIISQ